MPERIFLTYTNATAVPYQGSTIGHHIVLNYVDKDGNHHRLDGGPSTKHEHNADKFGAFIADKVRPDGVSVMGPSFGRLQSRLISSKNPAPVVSHTMIAEGDDLSSQWTRMKDTAPRAGQDLAPGRPTTFDDRFANWIDSDGVMAPLAPHRAPPPEEDNRPRGIFSGKPMPNYPVPPPIFGFPEPGAPYDQDWLLQLLAPGKEITTSMARTGIWLARRGHFGNREIGA